MGETHEFAADGIAATVCADGAELTGLRDADGADLLWQAGPAWPRHAPILFPIVGRLARDTLRHAGREHRLTQHGFARDRTFVFVERTAAGALLRLEDDAETRAAFPFPFRLEQRYAASDGVLTVTTRIGNPGDGVLPCGIGAHPAFRWPLIDGCPKERHELRFETAETGPVLSVVDGLLGPPKPDVPFEGRRLALDEALFRDNALVLPDVRSRSVRFAALGADGTERRAIAVSWSGYGDLGVWSKPEGAPFLCIEPWFSMASPVGFDGDFVGKPGLLTLQPGETRDFVWRVDVAPPAAEA